MQSCEDWVIRGLMVYLKERSEAQGLKQDGELENDL